MNDFGAPARKTEREQRLRNEVGQLTRTVQRLTDQRKEMQSDLVAQRADMTTAVTLLEMGRVRDAIQVLKDALAYRERNREPRKNPTPRDHVGPV